MYFRKHGPEAPEQKLSWKPFPCLGGGVAFMVQESIMQTSKGRKEASVLPIYICELQQQPAGDKYAKDTVVAYITGGPSYSLIEFKTHQEEGNHAQGLWSHGSWKKTYNHHFTKPG